MDALLAEPQRFKFFQAVRLLEQCFARQERGATRHTVPVHLRFPNAPGLGFPPSEIVDAVAYDKHGEVLADEAEFDGYDLVVGADADA